MSAFHSLTIKEITRETPHAISVVFEVPEQLQPDYRFIAGQYLNLKFIIDGKEIRRAYSISSSPNNQELRVAIKAVQNGLVSTYANEKMKVGDKMEVGTPEGRFTFEPKADNQKNYAAFAAGSGITPVMSILHSVLENEPQSTFVLIYGNKSPGGNHFLQTFTRVTAKICRSLVCPLRIFTNQHDRRPFWKNRQIHCELCIKQQTRRKRLRQILPVRSGRNDFHS